MDNGYLIKFKNYSQNIEGTGKLHYNVLSEIGKCIWGQWSESGNSMYESTFQRMNKEVPFFLYALDKNFALLKMKVERVLKKEEILEEQLGYLIPTYYSVDTPCSSYYLISQIDIFPVEEAKNVIINSSGNNALLTNQINSRAPMAVHWSDKKISIEPKIKEDKPKILKKEIKIEDQNNNYVVYRYKSKIDNKCYIGLTGNLEERIRHHKSPSNWKSSKEKWKILYIMFSLYGYENYDFEILHKDLTKEEAEYWEAKEIENHNCYYPNGLNVRNESRHLKS